MHRRYSLAHLILAAVVVLSLTFLMVCADAQAQIVFSSNRDGSTEIYVMDTDGKNQRRLTNNPASDYSPSWSPDGKRIVFGSDRDKGKDNPHNSEIYVMNADGKNQRRLTNNRTEDMYPAWSPDGERIAFSARREGHVVHNLDITYEIYVMDADGGNEQRLTENRNNDWSPSWSPDGERIAFASDRKGDWTNYDIYVMDADGENPRNITNHLGGDSDPAWFNSPFSVALVGKKFTIWGRLKQLNR